MKAPQLIAWVMTTSVLLVTGTTNADTAATAPPFRIYRLNESSTYQYGCFDACACPISDEVPIRGTFRLGQRMPGNVFDFFEVRDVNWFVTQGDSTLHITGQGLYAVSEIAGLQRLELDLYVGANAPEHFHSNEVPYNGGFPNLDLVITINDFFCLDTVIHVEASPVPVQDLRRYRLLPTSRYQQGCFDPCDCVLHEPQPLLGRFTLVKLSDNGLFAEYAVLDARWLVLGSNVSATAGFPITGSGLYRVGGEFAALHQLQMDLSIDHAPPIRVNSGLVIGGTNFPAIDILASENGLVCFDRVVTLHARPIFLHHADAPPQIGDQSVP